VTAGDFVEDPRAGWLVNPSRYGAPYAIEAIGAIRDASKLLLNVHLWRPRYPTSCLGTGGWVCERMVFDTGSSFCHLTEQALDALGFRGFVRCECTTVRGVNGDPFLCGVFPIEIRLGKLRCPVRVAVPVTRWGLGFYRVNFRMARPVGRGILGMHGLLDRAMFCLTTRVLYVFEATGRR
jgi:hypothetical protein